MKAPKVKTTTVILWIIYLFLLGVLLPHTAWAFRAFEPAQSPVIVGAFTYADLVSYIAALAFEAAIAVLTHKLAEHIGQADVRRKSGWDKFKVRYLNAFSLGLVVSTVVSSLANLAHAIEFAQPLAIFAAWGIPLELYAVAFGGVLPFVSLLFARVLSNISETEADEDPALAELRESVRTLTRDLRQARKETMEAEARAQNADARFEAAGDIMRALVDGDKRERILAVRRQWPQLTGNAIAVITQSAPSYVSEVISEVDHA